jgi:hypothetical protein
MPPSTSTRGGKIGIAPRFAITDRDQLALA